MKKNILVENVVEIFQTSRLHDKDIGVGRDMLVEDLKQEKEIYSVGGEPLTPEMCKAWNGLTSVERTWCLNDFNEFVGKHYEDLCHMWNDGNTACMVELAKEWGNTND